MPARRPKISPIRICGRVYDFAWKRMPCDDGQCDTVGHKISINPDLSDAEVLETVIHEAHHAMLDAGAADLARLIRRLGFQGPNE